MKFKTTLGLTLAGALLAQPVLAQPTTGAYVSDLVNSYVNDDSLEAIDNVSNIMCFMGSMRPEQKVGAGNYKALVDQKKCQKSRGGSESTSSGANAEVKYTNAVVNSTRASINDPMSVKAWVLMKEQGFPMTIYTNTSVTSGYSDTSPNGIFTMNFGGYADAQPTTPMMTGSLSAQANTITFYEEGNQQGAYNTQLTITQTGTDTGNGRAKTTQSGKASESTFAYNATHFKRQKSTHSSAQCFSRLGSEADASVWRYGVYNADGSRLNLTNPGFPVNFTSGSNTYYGYAGFYGIFFPDDARAAMGNTATLNRPGTTNAYQYTKVGGRLTKNTRVDSDFSKLKGIPMRVWEGASESEYKWNGTNIVKTRTITCNQSSCSSTAASGTVTADFLRNNFMRTVNGWSEALGGPFMFKVPDSGEFSDSTPVYYRTRTVVTPAQAATLNLKCVSQCLGTTSQMNASLPGTAHVNVTSVNGPTTNSFFPVLNGNAITYVFDASGMMYANSVSDANKIDGSSFTSDKLKGNNEFGLRTGAMVSAADLSSVQCAANGSDSASTHICPHKIFQAADTYEWETGNKPWNQNAILTLNGSAVTFDPPKRLSVSLSTSNTNLKSDSDKIGATIQLTYGGFGDLQGIFGSCYNRETNEKTLCGPNTGYAPDFALKAGATVTDINNTVYYVKPLDQELRFKKVDAALCAGLTLPTDAVLPTTATDPKALIGALPTDVTDSTAPAVIHGVVQ